MKRAHAGVKKSPSCDLASIGTLPPWIDAIVTE